MLIHPIKVTRREQMLKDGCSLFMIIKDYLYGNRKHEEKVKALVGPRFDLWERIKMGRIGSSKMPIVLASAQLKDCFHSAADNPTAILSLRKGGLLVHLNSGIYSSLWAIPFYRLTIYKSDGWSIHAEGMQVRLSDPNWTQSKFMSVLNTVKAEATHHQRIDDQ